MGYIDANGVFILTPREQREQARYYQLLRDGYDQNGYDRDGFDQFGFSTTDKHRTQYVEIEPGVFIDEDFLDPFGRPVDFQP